MYNFLKDLVVASKGEILVVLICNFMPAIGDDPEIEKQLLNEVSSHTS